MLIQNNIHPTAYIAPDVKIGSGNYIGPYVVIDYGVTIGNGNYFASHCVIGSPAEHKDYFLAPGKTIIGNNNRIHEFVTVNRGTEKPTEIKNDIILLRGSHVGHDSVIHDKVTISCNVMIGGHSTILEGANLGLGAVLHQYSVIGHYCMVGMGSVVIKSSKALPGITIAGNPAKWIKKNKIGLKRANITTSELEKYIEDYENICSHLSI